MLSRRCALLSALCVSCAAAPPPKPAAPAPPAALAPATPAPPAVAAKPVAPLPPRLEGLGSYRRVVTGASPEAQAWFDQGLNLLFAFNHDEAIRAFEAAEALSPACPMAPWGIAYASGPHINNPAMSPEQAKAAVGAVTRAQALAAQGSKVEQALIAALSKRYADPQPAPRTPLDAAYAEAMRGVRKAFPEDAEVAVLTAEALMDLHPWELYAADGKPLEWSPEILAVLDAALALSPRHPMANHLLIHAVEGSPHPERADRAAELLRDLQPGLGHMVHMPSHIDVRTGRWDAAIAANRKGIEADERYRKLAPEQGFYAIYMAHNHQMLAYAAMMSGRSAEALAAAKAMVAGIPEGFRKEAAPMVDGYYAMPLEVLLRFGRWDEVLAFPEPETDLPATRAIRHAARGIAFAARKQHAEAAVEQKLFTEGRALVPKEGTLGQNPTQKVLEVVAHLLAGELLVQRGEQAAGLKALALAVAAEDALGYDEPPDWMQPVRHTLGAALSLAGKHAEAEAVFREDLRRTPGNGWSLYGLARALKATGKKAEAAEVEARFKRVWEKADVPIKSACMCLPGV